ncbi:unnamed protein product [Durusdinium trenchii]
MCLEQANAIAFTRLLDKDHTVVSKEISEGQSALIFALDKLSKTSWDSSKDLMALNSMIMLLIENKADLNRTAPPHEESPLQILLRGSHADGELAHLCKSRLAVAMLRSKADPNHVDRNGESPLSEAAFAGDFEMCRLLLDHGAYISTLRSVKGLCLEDLSLDRKVSSLLREAASNQDQMMKDLMSSGKALLSSGKAQANAAQLCFLKAMRLDPFNPDILLAAAEADYVSGSFEKAYREASKVVALAPLNGLAYELCAKALWRLNRIDEAFCLCTSMVPSGASHKMMILQLEEVMVKHLTCIDGVEAMLSDSSKKLDLALSEKAFQNLHHLLFEMREGERCSPWGVRARLGLVKVCLFPSPGCSKQKEEARKSWTSRALCETRFLRKHDASNGEVLYWHARALLYSGCRQDALNALSCAGQLTGGAESHPLLKALQEAEDHRQVGQIAAKKEHWQAALESYSAAVELHASTFDPMFLSAILEEKGFVLLNLNQMNDALSDLTLALEIKASPRSYFLRGRVRMALEQYSEAASDFDHAAVDPDIGGLSEERAKAHRYARCPPVPDYYAALKLPSSASKAEVRKAYRLQALRWHPDKNVGNESVAEQAFKLIQVAFDTLSDERRRKEYDEYQGDRKPFPFGDEQKARTDTKTEGT